MTAIIKIVRMVHSPSKGRFANIQPQEGLLEKVALTEWLNPCVAEEVLANGPPTGQLELMGMTSDCHSGDHPLIYKKKQKKMQKRMATEPTASSQFASGSSITKLPDSHCKRTPGQQCAQQSTKPTSLQQQTAQLEVCLLSACWLRCLGGWVEK